MVKSPEVVVVERNLIIPDDHKGQEVTIMGHEVNFRGNKIIKDVKFLKIVQISRILGFLSPGRLHISGPHLRPV